MAQGCWPLQHQLWLICEPIFSLGFQNITHNWFISSFSFFLFFFFRLTSKYWGAFLLISMLFNLLPFKYELDSGDTTATLYPA